MNRLSVNNMFRHSSGFRAIVRCALLRCLLDVAGTDLSGWRRSDPARSRGWPSSPASPGTTLLKLHHWSHATRDIGR